MSSITILGGDWEILLDDEKNQNGGTTAVAGMRTIQKAVASPAIVTTRVLYSAVAEVMDDFIAMGFRNAMLPTTPNAFTLENQYFMPRSSVEFLKEGAITANWSLTSSPDTNGNGVIKLPYTVGGGSNFVAGDIGRRITDGTDFGTLLDFDIDPDGTLIAWIRPENSGSGLFDTGGTLQVTTDGGTGTVTVAAAANLSGTTQWSAIQAIGSVPTATEVYLYQNRIKLPSSDGSFQWWVTDTTVSLGIISVLVQVRDSGVLIADGDVEVFARRYTALYDNFRLNVVAGGFSALPLASSPDINNTTGYRTWTANTSQGSGTFDVGNGIYTGATWATATKRGVITAVSGTSATPTVEYYLVGDLTDFAASDTIQEYDFDTQADGDGDVTGTGILAPTNNLGGPTDSTSGEGGTVTLGLGGFLVDHDGLGGTEPYSVQVNAQGNVPIAKVYERLKYVTRRGAPNTDLFGASVNIPGESYRGLDAVVEYDTPAGTLTEGDNFNVNGGTWTSRLLHQNTTNSPTYVAVTDQQTSVDSLVNDDVLWDESQTAANQVLVNTGTLGIINFTSPKSSPFGTFTGSQIFGARGVSFINPNTGDEQAYILTDDLGTLRTPPNTVSFTVTNTAALDRILVARDTGTAGIINKDQFGGVTTATVGGTIVTVTGTIDTEVPQTGYVRIVDNTLRQEHHYVYDSRVSGASGTFTLRTASSFAGTATAGTSATVLEDTGQTFVTHGVEVGMLIRVVTGAGAGEFYEVTAVTDEDTLAIVQVYGTTGAFVSTDTYEINKFIKTYAGTDDLYDLIIDAEATTTSFSNTFTKTLASNFDVVVNVRQGKIILPFTLNQTQGDGSTTVTVVRQPDTIAV